MRTINPSLEILALSLLSANLCQIDWKFKLENSNSDLEKL